MDRVLNAWKRELCRVKKGKMKGLIKECCGSSAMWRGWRGIGLSKVYVGECAGSHSGIGHRRDGLIP